MSSRCRNCDAILDPSNRNPCPICHDTRRVFRRELHDDVGPVTDSVSVIPTFHAIRNFYQENPKIKALHLAYVLGGVITAHFISPFDFVIGDTLGAIIGLMCFVHPPYTKNHLYP